MKDIYNIENTKKFSWGHFGFFLFYFLILISAVVIELNIKPRSLGQIDFFYISIATLILFLLAETIISFILAVKKWKELKIFTKITFILTFLMPLIILIGGHFSIIYSNLVWNRAGELIITGGFGGWGLDKKPLPPSTQENFYGNLSSLLINGGFIVMAILIIILVATLISNYKKKLKV